MPLPFFEVDVPIRSTEQPGVRGLHVFTGRADSRSAAVRIAHEVYDAARAATPDVLGTCELTALQRAADAALYDGKHSGRAVLATGQHVTVPSINGRRAGRPGTSVWGRAA